MTLLVSTVWPWEVVAVFEPGPDLEAILLSTATSYVFEAVENGEKDIATEEGVLVGVLRLVAQETTRDAGFICHKNAAVGGASTSVTGPRLRASDQQALINCVATCTVGQADAQADCGRRRIDRVASDLAKAAPEALAGAVWLRSCNAADLIDLGTVVRATTGAAIAAPALQALVGGRGPAAGPSLPVQLLPRGVAVVVEGHRVGPGEEVTVAGEGISSARPRSKPPET
jgi:antitoxin (DNA-binding transcriptional repressor) of toxin-antitoxin stability system